jgi:hypothetical protein
LGALMANLNDLTPGARGIISMMLVSSCHMVKLIIIFLALSGQNRGPMVYFMLTQPCLSWY